MVAVNAIAEYILLFFLIRLSHLLALQAPQKDSAVQQHIACSWKGCEWPVLG